VEHAVVGNDSVDHRIVFETDLGLSESIVYQLEEEDARGPRLMTCGAWLERQAGIRGSGDPALAALGEIRQTLQQEIRSSGDQRVLFLASKMR
jgi:hypothetical protein